MGKRTPLKKKNNSIFETYNTNKVNIFLGVFSLVIILLTFYFNVQLSKIESNYETRLKIEEDKINVGQKEFVSNKNLIDFQKLNDQAEYYKRIISFKNDSIRYLSTLEKLNKNGVTSIYNIKPEQQKILIKKLIEREEYMALDSIHVNEINILKSQLSIYDSMISNQSKIINLQNEIIKNNETEYSKLVTKSRWYLIISSLIMAIVIPLLIYFRFVKILKSYLSKNKTNNI